MKKLFSPKMVKFLCILFLMAEVVFVLWLFFILYLLWVLDFF